MWLLTTVIAAILVTMVSRYFHGKYKLDIFALMIWGATLMILVDHILGYEGGPFLEETTDGLIGNATFLGLLMLLPVIFTWLIILLVSKLHPADTDIC